MLAILSAPGSRGDVNPMIAIGRGLRARGYEVMISLAQPYADLASEAGLKAVPLISKQRFDDLLDSPNVWKPIRGARTLIGTVASEFMTLHLDVIKQHHVDGQTVLVSHPLDLASRIFREAHPKTPLIDVHLAPSMLRTYDDPPKMTPWSWEFSRPTWAVRLAYRIADRLVVDPMIAHHVNRVRRQMESSAKDYKPVGRIIDEWWLSPDRILAMYPRWFAPATAKFSPRLVHCGFPLPECNDQEAPKFDQRPIVFTCGTAHRHSKEFFKCAVSAASKMGHPAILLSTHAENFPSGLPPQIQTADYLPLNQILPECRLMVHHGGVGTTSACMAAGIPQIIRPMAFDQFDNANRVEKLKVGRWLKRDRDLASVLDQVVNDASIAKNAKELSKRIANSSSGVQRAVEAVCEFSQ